MKLYLSSYKLGNKTDYLKEWIKEHGNNILMISNAKDDKPFDEEEKEKLEYNVKVLEDVGFNVTLLDLRQYFNNNDKLMDDIRGYNAFFVRGGNTFVLRKAMSLSGFDKFLVNNKTNDKILYIGESAGTCVLAKNLDGVDIEDNPINVYNDDVVMYEGVGLLDFSPVPHYKSEYVDNKIIDDTIDYMKKNNIEYKTIKDGEVIIFELS